ncbi:hypothetical protein BU23DRAFT_104276 [Bimuria novae-zelandiae CBS 107.79]|uniref:Uncharacterized protein n=1 Tax=Bimuria novae-zelandiae CBS 107.79 TaxID=1447943 RepID=A0A6A5VSL6_9PLEO|nr:hypothetical protein BU23DRAFT_104276 [Bimuria novae-zelandiae CBS 107.79]
MRLQRISAASSILVASGRSGLVPTLAMEHTKRCQRSVEPGGLLYIINSCEEDFTMRSEGAWPQSADRSSIEIPLPAGDTCHKPVRETSYDSHPIADQVLGNAMSVKITKPPNDWSSNILQFEYALGQNTETFKKLWYDISLLNCAVNTTAVTDV